MSATGGMRWRVRAAWLLAVAAAAAGLAGCEYADDAGLSPVATGPPARSYPARSPLPTRDPELVAAETRNLLDLGAMLGDSPDGLLVGGSGGLGGTTSGGFSTSGTVTRTGQYRVSAACLGAPEAHLSVTQSVRKGGTRLELSLGCGSVAEALVDLEPGTVSAYLVSYGGGVPGPGTGAAAGIRIALNESH